MKQISRLLIYCSLFLDLSDHFMIIHLAIHVKKQIIMYTNPKSLFLKTGLKNSLPIAMNVISTYSLK